MLHRIHIQRHFAISDEALWTALTDYSRLVSWFPGVTASSVLVREGDVAAIELHIPDFGKDALVLEIVESAPRSINFQQVDFYDRHGVTGSLALHPDDGGTLLRVSVCFNRRLFDMFTGKRAKRFGQRAMDEAFKRSKAILSGQVPVSGRRKILEVHQKTASLEIWFRGEVFTYNPTARATTETDS